MIEDEFHVTKISPIIRLQWDMRRTVDLGLLTLYFCSKILLIKNYMVSCFILSLLKKMFLSERNKVGK